MQNYVKKITNTFIYVIINVILMLLNFTCSNFRSFRDEQTILMTPGSTRNHQGHIINHNNLEILSLSAIFGANASGKSNIYKAMRYSRDFILGKKIDKNSYFRLDPKYKEMPSVFEYEFTVGDNLYRYGFSMIISKGKVEGEWLWRMSNSDEEDTLLFQRPLDSNQHPKSLSKFKLRISKFLLLTLSDELGRNPDSETKEILDVRDWFENNLKIISTEENLLGEMDYSEEQCEKLGRFLSDFDVGIVSTNFKELDDKGKLNEDVVVYRKDVKIHTHYVVKKSKLEKDDQEKKGNSKKLLFLLNNHGSEDEQFLWFDESDGTRRLMDLAPAIISDESDVTYVIDELDRSLHPLVVYEYVRKFASFRALGPKKQLLFTTHQTCLLDQELLRRDEIWFVEKNRDGSSDLFSLDVYKERFDKNLEKLYLNGRYGAIPRINKEDFI